MFEFTYGNKLSEEKLKYYRNRLIETFAREYNIENDRLWNCLRKNSVCLEFEDARMLDVPQTVILYLERQNEVYNTTFDDICRYVDELEPCYWPRCYVFGWE